MLIDIRILFTGYLLFLSLCVLVLASLWLQNRKSHPEILLWLIDFVLQLIGILFITLRGIFPDFVSILLANVFIIGGTIILFRGLERYVGKEGRQLHNYALLIVFTLVHATLIYVYPSNAGLRPINQSLALLFLCVQCAWLLLRRTDQDLRPAARAPGVVFILFCLVCLANIITSWPDRQTNSLFMPGVHGSVIILSYQILMIALTFALFLMVNQRITRELEQELGERQRVEAALRASEEQVRLLLNSTAEAIYGIDLQGNCTFANPACLQMLGYPAMPRLLGQNMHNLIHHSYADGSPMAVQVCRIYRAFHEGKGMHVDDEVLWKANGSSFPVEYWSYPQIVDGRVIGAVVTFVDITERRRLEEELKRSEKQHRLLMQTLPLAVFVDIRGKIVYVNPAFLTLFKATSSEAVLGMRVTDFVSPELYDVMEQHRRAMNEENEIPPPLELNLRCLDGTVIMAVYTPMPMVFQEQPAVLSALYDISERKRNEIELQKAHTLLQIQVQEIEDLQAKLKEQVIHDPLTGLYNRRYLEEALERELARASRSGFPIGMVMIDIDRFKEINDIHGHQAGDLILQGLGKLLLDRIRAGDIACRYGGEEFLIILPQTTEEITAERAEQWRTGFEALRTHSGEKTLQATISLGVAAYPGDGTTMDDVIRAADDAMYRAKAQGRNRVVCAPQAKTL